MDKLKLYEAKFNPLEDDGVFSISLVGDPAMQSHFIALKKQTPFQLKTIDEEKRIIIGLVLEPDKLVYRRDEESGEEFNIVFRSDTILELSKNFFKKGFQLNSKLEHNEPIKGVYFYESWIVEDSKKDKSFALGMEFPVGSWVATMHIENDEIWNDYIKSGELKGFSIDGLLSLKEVNLKSNIKMNEIVEAIKEGFKAAFSTPEVKETEVVVEEVKLGQVVSGDVTIDFEGEALEAGVAVWVMQGEEKVALPVGEYPLDEGRVLVVAEEGIVSEVKAMEEELEAEPVAPTAAPSNDELTQAIKSLLIKYKEETDARFDKLEAEFKAENEKLKGEVTELSNEPAAKPIVASPSVKLTKQGRILNKLRNN